MSNRIAFALPALLLASTAFALPVCPPPSYTSTSIRHFNNEFLASEYGPTPAGTGSTGKCGITTMRAATAACPAGQLSHFAYDIFDLWSDTNPPIHRVFSQELHVNNFDGIPVGDHLKIAELKFASEETVSFYFDRRHAWLNEMTVVRQICEACAREEITRFVFPTGMPQTDTVSLTINWATGRYPVFAPGVDWTVYTTQPYNPINIGSVELLPGAREVSFSNGIVNSSCDGNEATRIRFVRPRFDY